MKKILLLILLLLTNIFANEEIVDKFRNANYLNKKIKDFFKYEVGTGQITLAYKDLKKILNDKEELENFRIFNSTTPELYWEFKDYKNLKGIYRKLWLYMDHLQFEIYKPLMLHNYMKYKKEKSFVQSYEQTLYNILLEIQTEEEKFKPKITHKQLSNIKIIIAFDKFIKYNKEHNHINYINTPLEFNEYAQIKNYFNINKNYYIRYHKLNDKFLNINVIKVTNFLIKYNLYNKYKTFLIMFLRNNFNISYFKKYYFTY